jgi:hypothetical protein
VLPQIYRFAIMRGLANAVFEATDETTGSPVTLYEWTPDVAEREASRERLEAVAGKLECEVFSADASLYLVSTSPEQAREALRELREHGLFVGEWPQRASNGKPPDGRLSDGAGAWRKPLGRTEISADLLRKQLDDFIEELGKWAVIAKLQSRVAAEIEGELHQLKARMPHLATAEALQDAQLRYQDYLDRLMYRLVKGSDLTLDKGRQDVNLQKQMNRLIGMANLEFIDPKKGEAVHAGLHQMVEMQLQLWWQKSARGTVAAVKVRGLRWTNGEVLQKAEIVVFD